MPEENVKEVESLEKKKIYVVAGATINCEFGTYNKYLKMPKSHGVYNKKGVPFANITDKEPEVNIPSFGSCKVVHPKPCVPLIPLNWMNGHKKVKFGGNFALLKGSSVYCSLGGKIKVVTSGQLKAQKPK